MTTQLEKLSQNFSFGGWHYRYQHQSGCTNTPMNFAIYLPPHASADNPVPVLYWLSGLTCSEENFMQKAGAQRLAAELGLAIVAADTSPRGEGVFDDAAYDLGQAASFYVDATQAPWNKHFQMYTYITAELPELIEANFPVTSQRSISGHSMGGHGALMIALRNPERYCSVSAFAPICQPSAVPWGQKALEAYLGNRQSDWLQYDSCALIAKCDTHLPIRIEQGMADEWLATELNLEQFAKAAQQHNYPVEIYRQAQYDHNYYFVASFIDEHLKFHSKHLKP